MELETSREKATELLQFTEKITAKNTLLSSENSVLQSKARSLESEVHKLQKELEELQTSYSQLVSVHVFMRTFCNKFENGLKGCVPYLPHSQRRSISLHVACLGCSWNVLV